VLSHFLLDGIVHVKGLPLAGNDGPLFGLGLWRHLPLELCIEAAMAALALWIYRSSAKANGSKQWVGMVVYIAALSFGAAIESHNREDCEHNRHAGGD